MLEVKKIFYTAVLALCAMVGVGCLITVALMVFTMNKVTFLCWLVSGVAVVLFYKMFYSLTEFWLPMLKPYRLWLLVFLGFLASVVIDMVLVFGFGQAMVSDFKAAQHCVEAGIPKIWHVGMASHWKIYELLISFIGSVTHPSLLTAQLINSVCISAVIYPVYKIAFRISGTHVAILVSTFLAFSPTILLYGSFLTSEFLCATFMMYAFYVCTLIKIDSSSFIRKNILFIFGAAILLVIADFFKPLGVIFIGASIMYGILFLILWCRDWRYVVRMLIIGCIFITVYKISQREFRVVIERLCPEEGQIQYRTGVHWYGLMVGLSGDSGVYTAEISKFAQSLTPEESKKYLIKQIKCEWRKMPKLFAKKFARLYWSDRWVCGWLAQTIESFHGVRPCLLTGLTVGWYFNVVLFFGAGIFGVVVMCLKRQGGVGAGVFSLLVILGFTILILLIEVQARYRMSVYPFYFAILPYAAKLKSFTGTKDFISCFKVSLKKTTKSN